jgi:hypothetical protein
MTSTSLSFVKNNIPFFLTIRRHPDKTEIKPKNDYQKIILQEKYRIKSLKKDFRNCSIITDNICDKINQFKSLSKKSLNKIEFVINELIENLYKYSIEDLDEYVTITIYAINSNKNTTTYVISTTNNSDRENIRGIVKSFKLIKKEFYSEGTYTYDKSFLGTRGHMGWITITKFNTMTHILATRINKNIYSVETNVLITE